eukprot:CAMPEP_0206530754 /NCGR_PEP_ID=MMETSP0325_2-20121206/3359_1 /ASSEMBLY_ACC=CAM_ASM_000347 /TAXON_ID=2866 /ORGANISM="Crypthecodinium cohnii, Strain Seligo" /LENGTH=549 /DNA_ID=CAMNT_0054026869 /DNA_START=188 /DNA_END=1837 /DNA_ORIENTATION=+
MEVLNLLQEVSFPFTHAAYVLGLNGPYFSHDTDAKGHHGIPEALPQKVCRLFRLSYPNVPFTTVRLQRLSALGNFGGRHRTLAFCLDTSQDAFEDGGSSSQTPPSSSPSSSESEEEEELLLLEEELEYEPKLDLDHLALEGRPGPSLSIAELGTRDATAAAAASAAGAAAAAAAASDITASAAASAAAAASSTPTPNLVINNNDNNNVTPEEDSTAASVNVTVNVVAGDDNITTNNNSITSTSSSNNNSSNNKNVEEKSAEQVKRRRKIMEEDTPMEGLEASPPPTAQSPSQIEAESRGFALFLSAPGSAASVGGWGDVCEDICRSAWRRLGNPGRDIRWASFARSDWLQWHWPTTGTFFVLTVTCEPLVHRRKLTLAERNLLLDMGFNLPSPVAGEVPAAELVKPSQAPASSAGTTRSGYSSSTSSGTAPRATVRSQAAVQAARRLLGFGLEETVDSTLIEEAFRSAVRRSHPDRQQTDSSSSPAPEGSTTSLAARTQGWAISQLVWARKVLQEVVQLGADSGSENQTRPEEPQQDPEDPPMLLMLGE